VRESTRKQFSNGEVLNLGAKEMDPGFHRGGMKNPGEKKIGPKGAIVEDRKGKTPRTKPGDYRGKKKWNEECQSGEIRRGRVNRGGGEKSESKDPQKIGKGQEAQNKKFRSGDEKDSERG